MWGFRNKYMLITYKLKEAFNYIDSSLLPLIGSMQFRKLASYVTTTPFYLAIAGPRYSSVNGTENRFTNC
jgi:hypothetical protein